MFLETVNLDLADVVPPRVPPVGGVGVGVMSARVCELVLPEFGAGAVWSCVRAVMALD